MDHGADARLQPPTTSLPAGLREVVAALLGEARLRCFFDVGPLLDENWTGIPTVAAGLAGALLRAAPEATCFVCENNVLPTAMVAEALERRTGLYLSRDFNQMRHGLSLIDAYTTAAGVSLGISPSVKRNRLLFDVECSIIHDISTLITPQFHTRENIAFHMQNVMSDLASNDVTFCVSEATLVDICNYIGTDRDKLAVARNGIEWPVLYKARATSEHDLDNIEPFLFILGTREPRKNIQCLFQAIEQDPFILKTYRLVVTGQIGWLAEREILSPKIQREVARGRIVFTGFLDEYQKYKLLRGAAATVYPSYYEGFGLPVLESLSVGTPCIASYSSSIPEVGGALCVYHDPFSPEDLCRAIRQTHSLARKADPQFRAACLEWAGQFTWDGMLEAMLTRLRPAILHRAGVEPSLPARA